MDIRKCYNLFKKTARLRLEALKLSAFIFAMLISVLILRNKVQVRISNLPFISSDGILLFIYFIMLIFLSLPLYGILRSALEKEFVTLQTIGFTKKEIYVISLLRTNYTFYLHIIIFLLVLKTDYTAFRFSIIFVFIASIISYLLIFTVIFQLSYKFILTGSNPKKNLLKYDFGKVIIDKYYKNHKSVILSKIKLDLALRYKVKSLCVLKWVLCFLAVFLAYAIKSAVICTIINITFILLIMISTDVFWKCERQNATIYRYMGLKFDKYVTIKIMGNFLFCFEFLLITVIATQNILYVILTLLISIFLSIYWSIILAYVFYNKGYEGLYDFIIIGYVFLMLVPGISLIYAVKTYKKCILLWNGEKACAFD